MCLKILINQDGFLIITCEAGKNIKEIHSRMPLIVNIDYLFKSSDKINKSEIFEKLINLS